ncbi:MAG: NAD(P)/FAD-dependent oxidoreductase [Acidobacteriota bacterium]|nr:NAD(P)/FAD-dependent oxidoreductase [Acidobacteriota bacterium]
MKSKIHNPKFKIVIVGAGPAGASLAIRLKKANFDVCLIERERFPRHKLCGEFVSPECLRHFRDLGVFEQMISAGGDRIGQTIFYEPNGKSISIPSKWFGGDMQDALSLSRAEMDFRLLEQAKETGVNVLEETNVVGVSAEENEIRGVKIKSANGETREIFADLFVDATGRANVLSKLSEREISREGAKARSEADSRFKNQDSKTENQKPNTKYQIQNPKSKTRNRLVGFKTHLKNVNLEKGACEIYFFRGGYGGLSFVENTSANHCFLIEADVVKEFNGDADKIVEKIIFQNKRARETMQNAAPVLDWLAVSVDGFGGKNLHPARNLLTVGDAAAFIDPFTGSGMLMAFESAEILAVTIAENASAPEKIAANYKILHGQKFQTRLRVCRVLRRAAFVPNLAKFAISALNLSARARKILARSTRQNFPVAENNSQTVTKT